MAKDQATYNKKQTKNDRLIFIVKLIVYIALVYVKLNHVDWFAKYNWLTRVMDGLMFFLGANLVISLSRLVLISWYTRKHNLPPLTRDNFVLGLNRISSVLNTTFIVLSLIIVFGYDLSQFITSITIVAAAIAILSKDYIANMINGLIIMFSDQLSLGDHIRIDDYKGKILDITLVNIVLQNDDDDIVLLPNSVIFTSIITNQSKQNIKKLSIEFELDIKHAQSPEELELQLKKAIAPSIKNNISEQSFSLKTLDIKKDLVKFKVQLLLPNQNKELARTIKRELNTAIMAISKEMA